MSLNSYHTLQNATQGLYKEKGSKFIAFAFPVITESEIKEKIDRLKKEYFDARHHCYAWILGADHSRFRAFDDGEPNHSAGDPILGQIRSKGITNVLIVVVRYFGGVKLGVGGLTHAYKAAAENALSKGYMIEKELTEDGELTFDYATTSEVMLLMKELSIKVTEQHFSNHCNLKIACPLKQKEKLIKTLMLMRALGKTIYWQFEDKT